MWSCAVVPCCWSIVACWRFFQNGGLSGEWLASVYRLCGIALKTTDKHSTIQAKVDLVLLLVLSVVLMVLLLPLLLLLLLLLLPLLLRCVELLPGKDETDADGSWLT